MLMRVSSKIGVVGQYRAHDEREPRSAVQDSGHVTPSMGPVAAVAAAGARSERRCLNISRPDSS
jgi:hypothetical protein